MSCRSLGGGVAPGAEGGTGAVLEAGRGRAAGAVALVGGVAGWRRGGSGEAATRAGVVVLEEEAVVVLGHQGVVGREVSVGATGADSDKPGRVGDRREEAGSPLSFTRPRTNQLRTAIDVLVDV